MSLPLHVRSEFVLCRESTVPILSAELSELGRINRPPRESSIESLAALAHATIGKQDFESRVAIFLSEERKVKCLYLAADGEQFTTLAARSRIFAAAHECFASAIFFAHNHPDQTLSKPLPIHGGKMVLVPPIRLRDAEPSEADKRVARASRARCIAEGLDFRGEVVVTADPTLWSVVDLMEETK